MKVTKEQFIGVTYEELLALNDELLAFNDELLAENEHMRLKDMAVIGELLEENERLKSDNAKLREELSKWERLTVGIDLPEYPVTQFKPKDLERENAELRELVRDMWGTMGLLDACAVDEYDEPLNCCTVCNQYGRVDDLAGGKRVIGCKLVYRMCDLGVDE